MKKNVFTKFMMLAMVAMTSVLLTACGGDDDDNNGVDTAIGVHRIDVQFNDDAAGCSVMNYFYGLRADASYANIYENGKKLPLDASTHTWSTEEMRNLSIQTEDGCVAIVGAINITSKNLKPIDHDVTVTVVGYVNGKRIKTQVFTLPAGKTGMSGAFSTSDTEQHDAAII
jgi:hypothetical protein